ncbi:MAG: HAMP domain-containing sensor histidine kinase [Chthoniobacteraceae bacterium]|nr:HAMP domain-containing sensor histidine kinase [Chthoniobacteraceae bacterium]
MTIRLPLSAKILLWFFLNLAALAAVFLLVFHTQFRFDVGWVVASSARQRVETLRELIVGELNTTPPDDWAEVIDRFSDAYGVHFSLFETNGKHLIGGVTELPRTVRERMLALPPISSVLSQPGFAPGAANPTRAFLRTGSPSRYWLLQRTRLDNPRAGGAMRVILVAEADSLSMGGLILDPAPWLWLMGGVVVFSVLFWLPLLHGMTRAIGQMTHTTRQIAEGRFDVRVTTRRGDELGLLAESINQMAARLNGLVRGQKRFLGDIAHELCSPLARLQMVLGILEQRAGGELEGYAASASEKAGQIAALVNELLVFSRASFGENAVRLTAVEVRRVVEEAVGREATEAVPVETDVAGGLMACADEGLLLRAVSNLLRNALRHGGSNGAVTVTARREGAEAVIRVADCGEGVPEEELPKLFDAFYRVDGSRTRETGGVGLGLTIVKTCVESCRGSVAARNRVPHGLEVAIRLPLAE